MMKLPELGAGRSPNVVDQLGLEKLVKAANGSAVKRPADGGDVKSVVSVSYTHLTPPTSDLVEISVGAGSFKKKKQKNNKKTQRTQLQTYTTNI